MTQRRLTVSEHLKVVRAMNAIKTMCDWSCTSRGVRYWGQVVRELDDMIVQDTTDGQPYVTPALTIPDGYRLAVAGDEGREDCEYLSDNYEWTRRHFVGRDFVEGERYIVPVDRAPTDKEARSRPEVMVRNTESEDWQRRTLLAVIDTGCGFICWPDGSDKVGCWRFARHLYPGE